MYNNIIFRKLFLTFFIVHNVIVINLDKFFIHGNSNSALNVLVIISHILLIFSTLYVQIKVSQMYTKNERKINEALGFNFITFFVIVAISFFVNPKNFGMSIVMPTFFQYLIPISGGFILGAILFKNKKNLVDRFYFEFICNFLIIGLMFAFKNEAIFFVGIKVIHFTFFHSIEIRLDEKKYSNLIYFTAQTIANLMLLSFFYKFNYYAFIFYILIQSTIILYLNIQSRTKSMSVT